MAISFQRYVDIISGVGAAAVVRLRELIGRLFTTNPLLPTQSLIEFETLDDVREYFGSESVEYLRALFYFGWVSKLITEPTKLAFARWTDEDTAPLIFGAKSQKALTAWTGISDGAFNLTLGADSFEIDGLDFTLAADLAEVATIIQTEIRTNTGSMWTAATVTYDPVRGSFNLTGGVVGAATVSVAVPAAGTNILGVTLLGWTTGAIFSDGALEESAVDAVSDSAQASTNFGSFAFVDTLSLEEAEEVAAWNTTQNNLFMFCLKVLEVDVADYYATLANYAGVAVTESAANEYAEQVPMMILAATDYTRVNAVQNYMFQQFNLTPTVQTNTKANTLDAARVNYYGRTQTAGQFIDFYQRGVLMGLPASPADMNVYANEIWLKDAAGAALLQLLLALSRVSANAAGRAQVLSVLQDVIDRALRNGVISIGKALNVTQKLFISSVTGDPDAWQQVQTIGYWIDCRMEEYAVDDRTEYRAVYLLVYAKDDAIRKVNGTHTLI